MHARAVAHGVELAPGQRPNRMKVVAPGPAVLVVDRDPEVAVDRVISARGNHGEARHHPGRDAPVVVAVLGIAPGADIEPARLLHDLEIGLHVVEVVLIAPGALEQRIGAEIAAVQERDVTGIDPALHGLQPVGFLQTLGNERLLGRDGREFPFRQRRLLVGRAHIGPQHRTALHQRIGLELDLLAEAALARLRGDVDALAGHVVFPAMVRTAQAGLFVAAEPERHAAMGAELVDQSIPALAVAEGKQPLREHLHPHRRAVVLRQLLDHERRDPVGAKHLAHRRAGAGLRQQVVLFFPEHRLDPRQLWPK